MTRPESDDERPETLAAALDALRRQVAFAIDEHERRGYVELERLERISEAATRVNVTGSYEWIRRH